tara:strand:- start:626 stop:1456 length:831 start_codon:yes stop_codon:yes gene_type:complete
MAEINEDKDIYNCDDWVNKKEAWEYYYNTRYRNEDFIKHKNKCNAIKVNEKEKEEGWKKYSKTIGTIAAVLLMYAGLSKSICGGHDSWIKDRVSSSVPNVLINMRFLRNVDVYKNDYPKENLFGAIQKVLTDLNIRAGNFIDKSFCGKKQIWPRRLFGGLTLILMLLSVAFFGLPIFMTTGLKAKEIGWRYPLMWLFGWISSLIIIPVYFLSFKPVMYSMLIGIVSLIILYEDLPFFALLGGGATPETNTLGKEWHWFGMFLPIMGIYTMYKLDIK